MNELKKYCSFFFLIGRSNTGKSTLINKIIGKKISIVSRKKNTTQNCILGIETQGIHQSIYIDTPGITFKKNSNINAINVNIKNFLYNTALILLVVDRIQWNSIDQSILEKIKKYQKPILLLINKIDIIKNKTKLLPHILFLKKKHCFLDFIPISAKNGYNIHIVKDIVLKFLKKEKHIFPKNHTTTQSKYFFITEIIREKLMWFLGAELPYTVNIKTKTFEEKINIINITSILFVNTINQKKIIIGKNGTKIKQLGIAARIDIEKFLKKRTHIHLWVQIKKKY